ncbi:hypothetical protein IWQ56_002786, partial [Coemansia nantahalensis]
RAIARFIAGYADALRVSFIALTAVTALYFVLAFGFHHVDLKTALKKTIDA